MTRSDKILSLAKTQLLLFSPFFGIFLCKHPPVLTDRVGTAAVDARNNLMVNPEFIEDISLDNVVFLLAHEVMHMVWRHALREGKRNHKIWNIACDAVVNCLLKKERIGKFIEGAVDMPRYNGWAVEDVYEELLAKAKEQGEDAETGDGDVDGYNPSGDAMSDDVDGKSASSMSDSEKRKADMEIREEIASSVATVKMRGALSSSLGRALGEAMKTPVPWYEVLEKFMASKAEYEQSWARPNKRFAHVAYLPSYMASPSMGEIVIGVDTSGSVGDEELAEFMYHVNRIVEMTHPAKVHVVYCNHEVEKVETYEAGDEIKTDFIPGGGGTDMREIFNWVDQEGISPDAVVVLTDGYTPYPEKEEYPTLWALIGSGWGNPLTGTVVRIA